MDIKDAQKEIERLYKKLPPVITKELNGGISILPQVKINPVKRGKNCYILGEYCSGGIMGRYINIYFGSFEAVLQGADEEAWKDKIREVLFHELTHHLEDLAGKTNSKKRTRSCLPLSDSVHNRNEAPICSFVCGESGKYGELG